MDYRRFLIRLGGLGLTSTLRAWMGTLDYRAVYYDETMDPAHPRYRGPGIFLLWHEYIPLLCYLRGHCDVAILVSRHADAEWLSAAAGPLGFQTVRGSTNRGGVAALRELWRRCQAMNLGITPDGPLGPRRTLAPGCIYLSSRLGLPLIAVGIGYDRPWRLPTWDQFAVPRPYSRARVVVSPAVQIPPDLDRQQLEQYRVRVETLLNLLTDEAERWATAGTRKAGERSLYPQAAPRRRSQPAAVEPQDVLPLRKCA